MDPETAKSAIAGIALRDPAVATHACDADATPSPAPSTPVEGPVVRDVRLSAAVEAPRSPSSAAATTAPRFEELLAAQRALGFVSLSGRVRKPIDHFGAVAPAPDRQPRARAERASRGATPHSSRTSVAGVTPSLPPPPHEPATSRHTTSASLARAAGAWAEDAGRAARREDSASRGTVVRLVRRSAAGPPHALSLARRSRRVWDEADVISVSQTAAWGGVRDDPAPLAAAEAVAENASDHGTPPAASPSSPSPPPASLEHPVRAASPHRLPSHPPSLPAASAPAPSPTHPSASATSPRSQSPAPAAAPCQALEGDLERIPLDSTVDVHARELAARVVARPLVVLEGFLTHPSVALDADLFLPQTLAAMHGKQVVDTLVQPPNETGWNLRAHANLRRPLEQYVSYLREFCFGRGSVRPVVPAAAGEYARFERNPSASPAALMGRGSRLQRDDQRAWRVPASVSRIESDAGQEEAHGDEGRAKDAEDVKDAKDAKDAEDAEEERVEEEEEEEGVEEEEEGREETSNEVGCATSSSSSSSSSSVEVAVSFSTVSRGRPSSRRGWSGRKRRSVRPLWPKWSGVDENGTPMVHFCVNVDIGRWTEHMAALERSIPSWLWCRGPHDLMRFVRQPVEGMNVPQVYLKVPGVWTGGHEENLRFHSINICHGPGASEWGAVDGAHAPRLRQLVLDEFGVDLYTGEGKWFPPLDFLRRHRVPFRLGLQRAGDAVVLRGGTLHWVRGCGPSVHSSWNFAPPTEATLSDALKRRDLNWACVPPLPSIVPMRTLLADVLAAVRRSRKRPRDEGATKEECAGEAEGVGDGERETGTPSPDESVALMRSAVSTPVLPARSSRSPRRLDAEPRPASTSTRICSEPARSDDEGDTEEETEEARETEDDSSRDRDGVEIELPMDPVLRSAFLRVLEREQHHAEVVESELERLLTRHCRGTVDIPVRGPGPFTSKDDRVDATASHSADSAATWSSASSAASSPSTAASDAWYPGVSQCQNVMCTRELVGRFAVCRTCELLVTDAERERHAQRRPRKGLPKAVPPPGRTDWATQWHVVQAHLTGPDLVDAVTGVGVMPRAVGMGMAVGRRGGGRRGTDRRDEAGEEAETTIGLAAALHRMKQARTETRAWRLGDAAGIEHEAVPFVLCVPCALTHRVRTKGAHRVEFGARAAHRWSPHLQAQPELAAWQEV